MLTTETAGFASEVRSLQSTNQCCNRCFFADLRSRILSQADLDATPTIVEGGSETKPDNTKPASPTPTPTSNADMPQIEVNAPLAEKIPTVNEGLDAGTGLEMGDPTETIRRQRLAEINLEPGSREILEAKFGKVWDTDQMREEFVAIGFMAPLIVVRRRSDGVKGSLEFQHSPRFYFNWQPHDK
jgi:hypothetical protein